MFSFLSNIIYNLPAHVIFLLYFFYVVSVHITLFPLSELFIVVIDSSDEMWLKD
jgi:hypothetical protein